MPNKMEININIKQNESDMAQLERKKRELYNSIKYLILGDYCLRR